MEEKKTFFLPKDATQREKNIRKMHIFGLILVVLLMGTLAFSVSFLIKSAISTAKEVYASDIDMESINDGLSLMGLGDITGVLSSGGKVLKVVSDILTYAGLVIGLGGSIAMLLIMKKLAKKIADDDTPMKNPIKVKKAAYVWLGFLLGAYGGHLFAIKKKKAWIFLILGILGFSFFIAFLYTTGISFADAFIACYLWKDHNGYIEIEDYPYWL